MKIKTVTKTGKVGTLTFEEDPTKQFKFWLSAPFSDSLTVGAVGEPKFRTEPAQGNFPEQKFLKSWNGVEEKSQARGGGGGGRLSPEMHMLEQRSILASVALKEARAHCGEGSDPGKVTATAEAFFQCAAKLAGVK